MFLASGARPHIGTLLDQHFSEKKLVLNIFSEKNYIEHFLCEKTYIEYFLCEKKQLILSIFCVEKTYIERLWVFSFVMIKEISPLLHMVKLFRRHTGRKFV